MCGADPSVLNNTDFAKLGHVYEGAWERITTAIRTAHRFGLGVLVGESYGYCLLLLQLRINPRSACGAWKAEP